MPVVQVFRLSVPYREEPDVRPFSSEVVALVDDASIYTYKTYPCFLFLLALLIWLQYLGVEEGIMPVKFPNGAIGVLFAPVFRIELPVVSLVKSHGGDKGIMNLPSCASIPRTHPLCAVETLLRHQCQSVFVLMQRQH